MSAPSEWEVARWEGGPHDQETIRFKGPTPLPEWRVCQCHGVAYRYVGVVAEEHLLVVELDRSGGTCRGAKLVWVHPHDPVTPMDRPWIPWYPRLP